MLHLNLGQSVCSFFNVLKLINYNPFVRRGFGAVWTLPRSSPVVIQTLIFDQFYHQENYYQLTVKARYGIHNFKGRIFNVKIIF